MVEILGNLNEQCINDNNIFVLNNICHLSEKNII